ncbi:hypothetical protein BBOV_II006105 [Babesia bovis T2Bo]|uniref:hypothetical protein n=1 Tax=Babesia bovis T2Bo TaxID=484906 RepID=UPI001C3519A6|nr:hypothetical protein BBOV_II006105 [Babesia bovis T2Bo]KAG6440177.1 hypothetical protein BBOV_II006105 [Babesia bovis T2Bo]
MRSVAPRRIERMLSFRPMNLSKLNKIEVNYNRMNECASYFVKNLVPLMAYGNKHIQFNAHVSDEEGPEYCKLSLASDDQLILNLKLYKYPLQVMQRIVDVAEYHNEHT